MSALPEEALLGPVKRMFQSWYSDADGLYYSRCTITRDDGVPEVFDGRASSPREAKKNAIILAVGFIGDAPPAAPSTKSSHRASSPESISQELRLPRKARFTSGRGSGARNVRTRNAAGLPAAPPLRSAPLPPLLVQDAQELQRERVPPRPRRIPRAELPPPPPPGMQPHPYGHGRPFIPLRYYSCLPGSVQQPAVTPLLRVDTAPSQGSRQSRPVMNNSGNHGRRMRSDSVEHRGHTNSYGRSEGVVSSGSTGSSGRRSKRIKTNQSSNKKSSGNEQTPNRNQASTELDPDHPLAMVPRYDDDFKNIGVDDTGEDYMSKLNELIPKVKHRFDKWRIDYFKNKNGNSGPWLCIMAMRDKMSKEDANKDVISKKAGKKKKDSKNLAAKYLIIKLNEELDKARASGADTLPTDGDGEDVQSGPASEDNAVSILHAWWQKNLLLPKPAFDLKHADDVDGEFNGKTGWRCSLVVKLKGVEQELSFHGRDSMKNMAKKKAALKAVKRIRSLNLPGFEEALVQKKQDPQRILARLEREEPCPENTKDMCQESDESVSDSIRATESVFSLPPDFSVTIAYLEKDCTAWVSANVAKSKDIGVYIDSLLMRMEMLELAEKAECKVSKLDKRDLNCRVICFATDTSALLVCTDFFSSGRGGRIEIPKSVRDVLENPDIRKIGMWPDAAAAALRSNFEVNMSATANLSVDSFALSGVRMDCSMHSTKSIVDLWLKERFQPFSKTAIADVPGLQELMEKTDAVVAPAVYSALVGLRVNKLILQMASAKEHQYFGQMVAFQDLAERLTTPAKVGRKRPQIL